MALSSTSTFIVGDLLYTFSSCSDSKVPAACLGNGSTTGGIITGYGVNGFIISVAERWQLPDRHGHPAR